MVVRLPPLVDRHPVGGPADGRQDRESQHRLQGMARWGMLTARVMDHRDIGKHLGDRLGRCPLAYAVPIGYSVENRTQVYILHQWEQLLLMRLP